MEARLVDRKRDPALGRVRGTYAMGIAMWRLRFLYTLLSPRPRLQTLLKPWVHDGEFAHVYDNAEDSFSLSDFTCMELGRILAVKEIARTFTDYAFLRIDLELARISLYAVHGDLFERCRRRGLAKKLESPVQHLADVFTADRRDRQGFKPALFQTGSQLGPALAHIG